VLYESAVVPHRIPPELFEITPPTQAKSVLAGSGPSLRPCGARTAREDPVHAPEADPGLHPDPRAAVKHSRPLPMAAGVHEDRIGLRLPIERRATGAEHQRRAVRAREREQLRHVVHLARHRHRLRDQAVRARIGRVRDQVRGAAQHAIGAERRDQLRAQRLGRARRNPVGGTIERRAHSIHIPLATGT
jgi:hypothetical protein